MYIFFSSKHRLILSFKFFFRKMSKLEIMEFLKYRWLEIALAITVRFQSSQLLIEQVYVIHVTTALSRWITISFIKLNIRRYNKHCTSSYIWGSVCYSHVDNTCMLATFHQEGGVLLREITPPHCIEVLVPNQVGEWVFMPMCVHVWGVDFCMFLWCSDSIVDCICLRKWFNCFLINC